MEHEWMRHKRTGTSHAFEPESPLSVCERVQRDQCEDEEDKIWKCRPCLSRVEYRWTPVSQRD